MSRQGLSPGGIHLQMGPGGINLRTCPDGSLSPDVSRQCLCPEENLSPDVSERCLSLDSLASNVSGQCLSQDSLAPDASRRYLCPGSAVPECIQAVFSSEQEFVSDAYLGMCLDGGYVQVGFVSRHVRMRVCVRAVFMCTGVCLRTCPSGVCLWVVFIV